MKSKGLSIGLNFGFGYIEKSYEIKKSEKEIIRNLILYFENKRALYNPNNLEDPHYVLESIIKIREKITNVLIKMNEKSPINYYLKEMRSSCIKFMNKFPKYRDDQDLIYSREFFASLGEVRAVFGFYLKDLVKKYGFEIEKDLKSIFPIDD